MPDETDIGGRTEEDALARAPIVVTFGGKQYEIKPLVLRESREWRKKYGAFLKRLGSTMSTELTEAKGFEALDMLLTSGIDDLIDLVFDYARDLPREEIEASATEAELLEAARKIGEIVFPFDKVLKGLPGT